MCRAGILHRRASSGALAGLSARRRGEREALLLVSGVAFLMETAFCGSSAVLLVRTC